MASIIRIKRSAGTQKPTRLEWGELAYVSGNGSATGVNENKDRIFLGDDGNNVLPVGGRYYTSMMSHTPGNVSSATNSVLAANGFVAILDSDRKVDLWNVDNLRLDANTVSSTNTDGDIVLDPNGIGQINIPDDTYLSFGTNKDLKIRYDELTDDRLEIEGSQVFFANTTDSSSADTGSVIFDGGIGIKRNLHVGSTIFGTQLSVSGISTFTGLVDANGGAEIDNIRIGIANDNEIDTSTGNLTIDSAGGTTTLDDNVSISGTLGITGATTLSSTLGVTGQTTLTGLLDANGGADIDNIRIRDNIISTLPGSGNVLYLDPYPDSLDNAGKVVIKGDLQVDGTTTSVNSTTVSLNDAIVILGDVTSIRTVMETVVSGVSTIRLDSVVGINTGDVISGSAALGAGSASTVTAYDTSNKIITLSSATLSGIVTTTQLTITHAFDTDTDRGVAFNYNTNSGVANNKIGFFGFIDGSIANSTATSSNHGTHANDSRRWTYIPDATISNELVTGTKGFLDVKGLYYQSGDFNPGGVVWFDSTGLQRSTNNPQSTDVCTSKQILTAISSIRLILASAITVNPGDIIRQDTTGAYGVVPGILGPGVSAITTPAIAGGGGFALDLIGVEDGPTGSAFGNAHNINREGTSGSITSLNIIPTSVTMIYINKPHWTSTLDGGTF